MKAKKKCVSRPAPRLLFLGSDFHCGSKVGLFAPGMFDSEGAEFNLNPVQRWLYDCWLDGTAWVRRKAGNDPHNWIFNGDLTEGKHHGGKQIVSQETGDHVDPAIALLQPLAEAADKTYIVKGTECHTGDLEAAIGKVIGAFQNTETKGHSFDRLFLRMAGNLITARHHFPATSRANLEAGQFSIQHGNMVYEAHRHQIEVPNILIGSHRHRMGHYSDGKGLTVVTPAWQALTRHGFKVVPDAWPNPGFYSLDWRNKRDGELPDVDFVQFFPPPPTIHEA